MLMSNAHRSSVVALIVTASLVSLPAALAATGEELLTSKCSACHARSDDGLERVKDSRRTPEGWDMTLIRMMLIHGVKYGEGERAALVKHLADTRGLAPSETASWRYVLERTPGVVEEPEDGAVAEMCARCHTYARVALQRRTEDEWLKLTHFHLGQYPTTEYQALGRDRNWWEIASTEMPKALTELYPYETDAWSDWVGRDHADLSGEWRIAGHAAGEGPFEGTLRVTGGDDDRYAIEMTVNHADGRTVSGSGNAIVYTGYEWRGSVEMDGATIHQVFAVSEDGNGLAGRWFDEANDVDGGTLAGTRAGPAIVAVIPEYLRAGETGEIAIHGLGLGDDVNLGDGVEVVETVSADAGRVVVRARAADDAAAGRRDVAVGDATASAALAVFQGIDSVRVEPANTIARVGGGGGPLPPVPAQFDAVAFANGADGEAGTDDDMRIGVVPATWSVEPYTEVAAAQEDARYAGSMDAASGLFMPAEAGLNPERQYDTNNVGDLAVKATVTEGGAEVSGTAHLVVTVQRWIDPPIR